MAVFSIGEGFQVTPELSKLARTLSLFTLFLPIPRFWRKRWVRGFLGGDRQNLNGSKSLGIRFIGDRDRSSLGVTRLAKSLKPSFLRRDGSNAYTERI